MLLLLPPLLAAAAAAAGCCWLGAGLVVVVVGPPLQSIEYLSFQPPHTGCYDVGTRPIAVLCVYPICPTGYPTYMSNTQFAGLVGSCRTGDGALPLMGKRRGASKAHDIPYIPYQNGDDVPKRHMRPHHHHALLSAHTQCKGYQRLFRYVSMAGSNDDRVPQPTPNTHY